MYTSSAIKIDAEASGFDNLLKSVRRASRFKIVLRRHGGTKQTNYGVPSDYFLYTENCPVRDEIGKFRIPTSFRFTQDCSSLFTLLQRFYLMGSNNTLTRFRVLKIDRMEPRELVVVDDKREYTQDEIKDLVNMIDMGNRTRAGQRNNVGGVARVVSAFGIVGKIIMHVFSVYSPTIAH